MIVLAQSDLVPSKFRYNFTHKSIVARFLSLLAKDSCTFS